MEKPPIKKQSSNIEDLIARDVKKTGVSAEKLEKAIEQTLSGTLISIDEWIDQTILRKRIYSGTGT